VLSDTEVQRYKTSSSTYFQFIKLTRPDPRRYKSRKYFSHVDLHHINI